MVYMYHSFLIHSSVDGHLGCFHVLAMKNSAAMNIGVHVSLSDLVSSVCMPRSGIAGSYGACLNSCPLGQWCHPTISSSVAPFFSFPQSFPPIGSFPASRLFTSDGQNLRASASVLPINIQSWFVLGLTGLISLQLKGLSRAFLSTTVQEHLFFGSQPSLWSTSHIHIWLLEKT